MPTHPKNWRARLTTVTHRETLSAHPWLRPISERLLHPQLWGLRCEAVARGVAIGAFWAFAIPFAQIIVAASHCVWWRANIPAAAAVTLVTNPLTIGFWLWLAYQTGAMLVGTPSHAISNPPDAGVVSWVADFGLPTVLGMGMFAVVSAALGYLTVKVVWRLRIHFKRRRTNLLSKQKNTC